MLSTTLQQRLDRLHKKPGDLTYEGCDINDLSGKPMVAVVGTRKPTPYGKLVTEQLVRDLVRAGVVIVSGLAIGIDGIAHIIALSEKGITIAVLPSGVQSVYPALHQTLAKKIVANDGALLSEYALNHTPRKKEFLERNRIIAALVDAVIIPEAAAHSGSLNTANHAYDMKIPVFAVPGPITSPMSAGTNYLLKEKAHTITEASDVFAILNINKQNTALPLDYTGDTEAETLILQKIAKGITNNHELQKETKLSIEEFQMAATMLEIAGRITQDESGNWNIR